MIVFTKSSSRKLTISANSVVRPLTIIEKTFYVDTQMANLIELACRLTFLDVSILRKQLGLMP